MATLTTTRVLPVTTAALEQEIRSLLTKYARRSERVLLLRAQPSGNGLVPFTVADRRVQVVVAASPLAVLERVTGHLENAGSDVLAVLTPAEEDDLGPGLLSHAIKQRIFTVEPWRVIQESFGAQHLDPRLTAESWAGESLLHAMPPGGWPKLAGGLLTRDAAVRALVVQRLRLDRYAITAANLDAGGLLLWSRDLEAVEAFRTLREAERTGLVGWLTGTFGGPAQVLFALVEAGNATDALALGLVCAALWHPDAGAAAPRSQGAVLGYISLARPSEIKIDDQAVRDFAVGCELLAGWMLADPRNQAAGHDAHAVLDRAEELLVQFGGQDAARHSRLLRSGLNARVSAVGAALRTATGDHGKVGELATAISQLRDHVLADLHAHRVRRAEMAQRLIQWLAVPADPGERVTGVGAAVQAQIDEWAWVDRARDDVWAGEDVDESLKTGFREVFTLVNARRRALDEAFAHRLAAWTDTATAAPSGPGAPLTVETVVPLVVAPLVAGKNGHRRPALFLVLDGMSTTVATELAEQLRAARWEEYDPLGASGEGARRRAVVAVLPTLTKYSRTSLLASRITSGGQDDERAAFETQPVWAGKTVRLFHKGGLPGAAGETLGEDLVRALGDEETAVAVVLNSIDDSLDRGRAETSWRIGDVTGLQALLDHARFQGRAIILTSDHGHVLEHGGGLRRVAGAESARNRDARTPATTGEIALAGARVATDDGQVIALWDPGLRYTARKAGYHGGASLAEVTIPLLAFLPLGAAAPTGWRALPDQTPAWWNLDQTPAVPAPPAPAKPRKTSRAKPAPEGTALFEVAEAAPAPTGPSALVAELLKTELFAAQQQLMPRKVPAAKIQAVLLALLETGGVLPLPVIAEKAGEPAVRASGFAATLQRILNVDNYPVLTVIDNGRNIRLDLVLLRQQFELKER